MNVGKDTMFNLLNRVKQYLIPIFQRLYGVNFFNVKNYEMTF